MNEQLNLSLSELSIAKNDFATRYQADDAVPAFPWEIRVNWLELVHAIESGLTWPVNETILRIYHRFDAQGWFLTVEPCHVNKDEILDAFGQRIDLRNDKIQVTTGFSGDHDPLYFSHMRYAGKPLTYGIHVSSVKLPWAQEFKEAADVNDILTSGDATITFSSISFDYGSNPGKVNVRWPHTLAFYFSRPTTGALLNNILYDGILVKAKAYDYAEPCPSDCKDIYRLPSFFANTRPFLQ